MFLIFATMADKKLILLTGVGRSGTTVLQSMLNAHSQISFPPETHFFKHHILPYLLHNKLPDEAELNKDPYLRRLTQGKLQAVSSSRYRSLDDLLRAFYKIVDDPASLCHGDKDTEYVRYLPHLQHLFPGAFLVHIVRDPRDVVASRLKTEWGSKHGLAFHAAEYQYYIKQMTTLGPRLFGKRFMQLRYEDLLQDPQRELEKMLEKLGMTFEVNMLDFHKSSSGLIARDEAAWKQNLDKPLLKSNQGKWKESLSEQQGALVESGIEDFMKANAYESTGEKPAMLEVAKKELFKILFAGKTFKERLR